MNEITFIADINCFSLNKIGGTDSYMRRIINCLSENHFKINLVYCNSIKLSHHKEKNVHTYNLKNIKEVAHFIKNKKDIFICYLKPTDRFKLIFYKNIYRLKGKINLIIFFYPESLIMKFLRIIEIILFNYYSVISVSLRIKNFIDPFKKRSFFLPPIIPDAFIQVGYKKVSRLEEESKMVNALFLGRIDPRKGINEIIKLANLTQEKISWKVSGIIIEKDNPELTVNILKKQKNIEFKLRNRERYTEKVDIEVTNLMYEADFFLQPYKNLSSTVDLPLLILEAQACGCIVLTTLPDILDDYIYYPSRAFKFFNLRHIGEYMSDFYINSEKIRSIKSTINKINEKYSQKVFYINFKKIIDD